MYVIFFFKHIFFGKIHDTCTCITIYNVYAVISFGIHCGGTNEKQILMTERGVPFIVQ